MATLCIRMRVRATRKLPDSSFALSIGKEYEVIGIEADSYRIIADDGQPYLYEPDQFEIVEHSMPDFWVREKGEDGELYAYPMAWFNNYFFERYFDGESGIRDRFWQECKHLFGIEKNA
jgi:hypothetical protein